MYKPKLNYGKNFVKSEETDSMVEELIKSSWKTTTKNGVKFYSSGPHSGKEVGSVRGKGQKKETSSSKTSEKTSETKTASPKEELISSTTELGELTAKLSKEKNPQAKKELQAKRVLAEAKSRAAYHKLAKDDPNMAIDLVRDSMKSGAEKVAKESPKEDSPEQKKIKELKAKLKQVKKETKGILSQKESNAIHDKLAEGVDYTLSFLEVSKEDKINLLNSIKGTGNFDAKKASNLAKKIHNELKNYTSGIGFNDIASGIERSLKKDK